MKGAPVLFALPLLAACSGVAPVDLVGRDDDATLFHLRIDLPQGSQGPGGPQAGVAIDAGHAEGSDTQTLDAGEFLLIGGNQISGPGHVGTTCTLDWLALDAVIRNAPDAPPQFLWAFGIGLDSAQVEAAAEGPGASSSKSATYWGLRVWGRTGWRPLEWIGPYVELGGGSDLGPSTTTLKRSWLETGLELQISTAPPSVTLSAAWSRIHLKADMRESDVEYEFRGWLFGLLVGF